MTDQTNAPQIASKSNLASSAVRAHITVAMRAFTGDRALVKVVDGGPITVQAYGRTIQITTQDITDQQ